MRTDPSRLEWNRLRTGLLLLAGIGLAALVVFFLDVVLRELSEGPTLHVAADRASNLQPGAAVWVAGVPAGRVTSVRFREPRAAGGHRVLVRAVLDREAAELLRTDASAAIREAALLAPSVVAVDPGEAESPFVFTDTLRTRPRIGADEILARADSLRERLIALRPLADSLDRRIAEGPGTLAAMRRDDALTAELGSGLARLRRLSRRTEEGSARLLSRDSTLAAAWSRIAARRDTLRRALPEGRLAELDRALAGLERRLAALERRLSEPRGTLGRLRHDGALERERRALEARLDSVRAELLRDPFAWLRVRLF